MNALNLAKYVITEANSFDMSIDPLKLQKLLYYIQGYTLSEFNFPAFDDELEHWNYGPVVREVYNHYNGNAPIKLETDTLIKEPILPIMIICKRIIKASSQFTSLKLSKMTHNEEPWKNTLYNEIIDKEVIKDFFKKNNPLNLTDEDFKLDENEYKKFSDAILERDKEIFKALS